MQHPLHIICLIASLLLDACSAARAPVTSRGEPPSRMPPAAAVQPSVPAAADSGAAAHQVVRGDTLYSIAWRYGQDYRDIARWNNITDPYLIVPGQRLRLEAPLPGTVAGEGRQPETAVTTEPGLRANTPSRSDPVRTRRQPGVTTEIGSDPLRWQWPTTGRVIRPDTPTARKGVDIAGTLGQAIHAAAAGAVVYSGSGLLGYGRLIIVKHSDSFLSAYAHNERLLVAEGDRVAAGQQIATMGFGNHGQPVLHFEIRRDGRPVNPLDHLPKSRSSGRS